MAAQLIGVCLLVAAVEGIIIRSILAIFPTAPKGPANGNHPGKVDPPLPRPPEGVGCVEFTGKHRATIDDLNGER